MAFDRPGTFLITSGKDKSLKFWLVHGGIIVEPHHQRLLKEKMESSDIDQQTQQILENYSDLKEMRLSDDEPMFSFHDEQRSFQTAHLAISANGDLFATSTNGSLVCFKMGLLYRNVCPVNLGQPIPCPKQSVVCLTIPDSRSNFEYMLIVTQDNHIIIHNPNPPKYEDKTTKSCQGCIKDAHSKKINAVLMDKRKNIIYSAGWDNSIKAWNVFSENHKCEFHSFPASLRFKN